MVFFFRLYVSKVSPWVHKCLFWQEIITKCILKQGSPYACKGKIHLSHISDPKKITVYPSEEILMIMSLYE